MKHKFSLSINQIFLTLVRNIVRLLQNRVDGSINTERQKSEDLARLINNYEQAVEKTIMDEVTNSIDKNEVLSFLTIKIQQSGQGKELENKIKKSRKIS